MNITIPDLDNDTLTYRFSQTNSGHGGYNEYSIERSINGGRFETIGKVRQTAKGDWNHSAVWVATAKDDETVRAQDGTRKKAARALEYRLQPQEYHDRKHAEYLAENAARTQQQRDTKFAALGRVASLAENAAVLTAFDGYLSIDQLFQDTDKGFDQRAYTPEHVVELLEWLMKP